MKSQGITDTSDYNLYGSMYQGSIYKIDLNGTITALNTSGNQWYGITQGSDKKLYGSVNNGFIYSISLDGVETAITSTNRGWYGICQVNVVQPVIKSVFDSIINIIPDGPTGPTGPTGQSITGPTGPTGASAEMITFDSSPQYGSTNPVTSNGIFNANSLIKANTDSKLNLRYAAENGGYIYKIDATGTERMPPSRWIPFPCSCLSYFS